MKPSFACLPVAIVAVGFLEQLGIVLNIFLSNGFIIHITMGAYVSKSRCPHMSKDMCNFNFNNSIGNGNMSAGPYLYGGVPTNPDIAGIGVNSSSGFRYHEHYIRVHKLTIPLR